MAGTSRGYYPKVPCSDCGKVGDVFIKHWAHSCQKVQSERSTAIAGKLGWTTTTAAVQ